MDINKIREGHVTILGWMSTDLKLKGNELFIYACIYGYSQYTDQFYGSLNYLATWTNSTTRGISKNLDSLVKKGLLKKKTFKDRNGVQRCEYSAIVPDGIFVEKKNKPKEKQNSKSAEQSSIEQSSKGIEQSSIEQSSKGIEQSSSGYGTEFHGGIEQSSSGYGTEFHGGIEQSSTNNINNNIYDIIRELYNDICEPARKEMFILQAEMMLIDESMQYYGIDDFKEVFERAKKSSWIRKSHKLVFKWLIKCMNMKTILNGLYDDKDDSEEAKPKRASSGDFDETTHKQMEELTKKEKEKQMEMASDKYAYLDDIEALGLR